MQNHGSSNSSDKQRLWKFLSACHLTPLHDFFSLIDEQTCVEAVNREGVQIFRSLAIFETCSYSLEDVMSVPWQELYSREQDITEMYLTLQASIVDGSLCHTDLTKLIPTHEVRETASKDRLVTTIQPLYLSPLHDSRGVVVGAIHAFKILDSRTSTPNLMN